LIATRRRDAVGWRAFFVPDVFRQVDEINPI
jgi:hypothetical protein